MSIKQGSDWKEESQVGGDQSRHLLACVLLLNFQVLPKFQVFDSTLLLIFCGYIPFTSLYTCGESSKEPNSCFLPIIFKTLQCSGFGFFVIKFEYCCSSYLLRKRKRKCQGNGSESYI